MPKPTPADPGNASTSESCRSEALWVERADECGGAVGVHPP
jgi:hypothetical protein